ncbi:MAG: alginate lyase family protein, partial [Xanthomonadales bacterium]|nr:alginate lyase family protein [Xanthomonadales bacterium]
EIAAIKVKIDSGEQPWKDTFDRVIEDAIEARDGELYSVTFGNSSSNIFYSEHPYCGWTAVDGDAPDCRDGDINPYQDRDDYTSAIKLSKAMRSLGLAYVFTNDSEYAEKAIELINTWAVNPSTRMRPGERSGQGGIIELYITIPGLFYGADLIWNYPEWDPVEKSDFMDWAEDYAGYIRSRSEGLNNFANWRLVLLASAGALLDNNTWLNYVETEWKGLLQFQMNPESSTLAGIMGEEYGRDNGLSYSTYAINAMIQSAEILRHRDVNLFDYQDSNGRGIELALDFITQYVITPADWPYKQERALAARDSTAMYELAYSHYQKQSYLDAINRWGRPMEEIRIMGITTLTHGNRFLLNFEPTPPSIITQPISQSIEEGAAVTFIVAASGTDLLYQWYRNGDPIGGAISASYTQNPVLAVDDDALYHSVVSNELGMAISDAATLTVALDTTPPLISSATVRSPTVVDIRFSERITPASAEVTANYQISNGTQGIQVTGAALSADMQTVQLQTDPLTTELVYTITVNNIQDTSSSSNQIAADSSIDITFAPSITFDNGELPFGWVPLNESRWSVVADNGGNVLFLNTTNYNPLSGGRLGEHILAPGSYTDFSLTVDVKTNEPAAEANADYALVFGFRGAGNYYYMLFNRTQSNTELFKVESGIRQALPVTISSVLMGTAYHVVEVRRVQNSIEVRFDNNLILQTEDSTFGAGKIGLGSFNDSSYFDNIRITGGAAAQPDVVFRDDFE